MVFRTSGNSLFPTLVVGSLPRTQWVREVIEDRKAGRLDQQEADRLFDGAIPSAIRMQERAGLERAMEFVPKERITLNPDCGFSPSSANPMGFDEAYLKLRAMCQGARMLREKYGEPQQG